MEGCYALRCELCTIATIFLGHQQALAVRWLVAFPICSLLLSKKGLWPSLWPVWHLFLPLYRRMKHEREKIKKKREKPFWKYLPFPKILHNADTICFMQELVLSRQSLVLPPCVWLELWLSHSAGWHWLALSGVLVAEPLVWKGGKRQQCMQSLVLPLSKAPSWVGLWEDLSVTPKE